MNYKDTTKRGWRSALVLIMGAVIVMVSGWKQFPTNTPHPPIAQRVIVISVDGLRADAVAAAPMPTLLELADHGAAAWDANTTYPSVTLIAHTSMLTGWSTAAHGVDYNSMPDGCPPILTPTFLTIAANVGFTAGMVVGKEKFCIFDQSDAVQYVFAREGDRSVIDAAIEMLEAVEVMFIHLPNADFFGHETGWMSQTYLTELSMTDLQIARLLTALNERGLRETTTIVITTDHGGHGHEHGTNLPDDMTIPFIIAGSGVQVGTILHQVVVADAGLTALYALGISPPETDWGRPLREAFAPDA